MKKCWANSLGNCEGGMSREHYVSKSLFNSPEVEIKGLGWCKDEAKRIGIESATAKILCQRHNNDLSELDTAASDFMKSIHEHIRLSNIRRRLKPKPVHVVRLQVNAKRLERWLLKVLLNLAFEGPHLVGPTGKEPGIPPDDLVETVFGLRSFLCNAGLYVGVHLGMHLDMDDKLQYMPLVQQGRITGGLFRVAGVMFHLNLLPEGIVIPFHKIQGLDFDWQITDLKWRFGKIKSMHGKYLSHVIEFKW